jgi:hypothetical protein
MTLTFSATIDQEELKSSLKAALAELLGVPPAFISFVNPSRRLLEATISLVVVVKAPTLEKMETIKTIEAQPAFTENVKTEVVKAATAELVAAVAAGTISEEAKNEKVATYQEIPTPVVEAVDLDIDETVYQQQFPNAPTITGFPTKQPTAFPTPRAVGTCPVSCIQVPVTKNRRNHEPNSRGYETSTIHDESADASWAIRVTHNTYDVNDQSTAASFKSHRCYTTGGNGGGCECECHNLHVNLHNPKFPTYAEAHLQTYDPWATHRDVSRTLAAFWGDRTKAEADAKLITPGHSVPPNYDPAVHPYN